jgi:hypothetical protein
MSSMRGRLVAIVMVVGAASVMAQAQQRFQLTEYSAKFMCGVVKEEGPGSPVQPGTYSTSINIHNAEIVTPVIFVKKVVLAPVESVAQKEPVPPSRFRRDELKPDFAEYVDCRVIRGMLGPAGTAPFVEGFVVVIALPVNRELTPSQLDVVGVYTVSHREGQDTDLEMLPATQHVLTFPPAAGAKMRDEMLKGAAKDTE